MKDWDTIFNNLSDNEKDKVAILRVMECANGIIQYAFRDGKDYALSIEETRKAMKFSMSCMKNMEIPLKEGTIKFESQTEQLMREVRDLYISGFKKGNNDDLEEFMVVSAACVRALGQDRIVKAKDILAQNITDISHEALDWGVEYLKRFLSDEYLCN
jgi:hypothetical protein